jgi:hypothetical protein
MERQFDVYISIHFRELRYRSGSLEAMRGLYFRRSKLRPSARVSFWQFKMQNSFPSEWHSNISSCQDHNGGSGMSGFHYINCGSSLSPAPLICTCDWCSCVGDPGLGQRLWEEGGVPSQPGVCRTRGYGSEEVRCQCVYHSDPVEATSLEILERS